MMKHLHQGTPLTVAQSIQDAMLETAKVFQNARYYGDAGTRFAERYVNDILHKNNRTDTYRVVIESMRTFQHVVEHNRGIHSYHDNMRTELSYVAEGEGAITMHAARPENVVYPHEKRRYVNVGGSSYRMEGFLVRHPIQPPDLPVRLDSEELSTLHQSASVLCHWLIQQHAFTPVATFIQDVFADVSPGESDAHRILAATTVFRQHMMNTWLQVTERSTEHDRTIPHDTPWDWRRPLLISQFNDGLCDSDTLRQYYHDFQDTYYVR